MPSLGAGPLLDLPSLVGSMSKEVTFLLYPLPTLKTLAAPKSSIIRQSDELRLVKLFLEALTSLNSSIRQCDELRFVV